VTFKPLLILTLAAHLCSAAFAQKPGGKPLSETDLLQRIESLTPGGATAAQNEKSESAALFDTGLGDPIKTGAGRKDRPTEKKSKGPTEITALEATFDQKANLAVFIGDVVVKDPEFNVICDKLTAHLKQEEKSKPALTRPGISPPVEAKKKSGGLEKAVAESTSDRRVIITQEKDNGTGGKTLSVGKADKATYDAVTGDVVLTGTPDVTQGINRVQATDPGTVMTLNRDGHMKAVGPHRTTIVEKAALQ
jgi:lipopolysaccharide export system protein LptA